MFWKEVGKRRGGERNKRFKWSGGKWEKCRERERGRKNWRKRERRKKGDRCERRERGRKKQKQRKGGGEGRKKEAIETQIEVEGKEYKREEREKEDGEMEGEGKKVKYTIDFRHVFRGSRAPSPLRFCSMLALTSYLTAIRFIFFM